MIDPRHRRLSVATLVVGFCVFTATAQSPEPPVDECVILLHGLARTHKSMAKAANVLQRNGYVAINVDYPSTEKRIEELANTAIEDGLRQCEAAAAQPVHFLTHSMGGILVRYYLAQRAIAGLGRVVMLSPPNQGSEVVDKLAGVPGYYALNGPAGDQLGTDVNSVPLALGPAGFELGVITGDRSINLFLSTLIPGADDGKVAVERAKLDGMTDFIVVPSSHPFIMRNKKALAQSIFFLQHGKFEHGSEAQPR